MPGRYVPLAGAPLGPVHVPPDAGAPPKIPNKDTAGPLEQTVSAPLLPAFGVGVTVTSTVAVEVTQGAAPLTV